MDSIPEKATRIVHLIMLAFLLISVRVWHLTIRQHEVHREKSKRPSSRTVMETPLRGTIRDRFNQPLAVNKIQYGIAISFDPIRRLPRLAWRGEGGKRVRYQHRKEYISALSLFLAKELELDADYIEDLLYCKAALQPNVSFMLKEGLSEEDYYRLKVREREWPGLVMQIGSKRHYPAGMVGGSIIGYLGAINEREYSAIRDELLLLEEYLRARDLDLPVPLPIGFSSSRAVRARLQELKDKVYAINSRIGKAGIEGRYDSELRGIFGRKKFEIDIKGNFLRELPESFPATPGRRFLLTISRELQEEAERLLMESELTRHQRFATAGKGHTTVPGPWIKGGAIVAIIPTTGEIVAMASYPRFDPNDFSDSLYQHRIAKWMESPTYIGQIWDGMRPLEREFSLISNRKLIPPSLPESAPLTWSLYLQSILSSDSSVLAAMQRLSTLKNALCVQNGITTLLELSPALEVHALIDTLFPPEKGHKLTLYKSDFDLRQRTQALLAPHTELLKEIEEEIRPFLESIPYNDDKILLLDLCRLACPGHLVDESLALEINDETIEDFRAFNQAAVSAQKEIRRIAETRFRAQEFKVWRAHYFKEYLAQKRKLEKERHIHAKPYLDYLEEAMAQLFDEFFQRERWELLAAFFTDNFEEISHPDYAKELLHNPRIPDSSALRERLRHLPSSLVIPYLKAMRSFDELNTLLWGRYYFPFKAGKEALLRDLARHFYPAPGFGYARSYAFQESAPLGSVFKIVTAYEGLRQHYLSQVEQELPSISLNPLTLIDDSPPNHTVMTSSTILGRTISGVPITRHYKGGRLPRGHAGIGKVDLPEAFERSSNVYFALLAADIMAKPTDLVKAAHNLGFGRKTDLGIAGEVRGLLPYDLIDNKTGLYSFAIGQHSLTVTPLQVALMLSTFANHGELLKPQIIHMIANLEPTNQKDQLFSKNEFIYQDLLANVGLYFPLFTEVQDKSKHPYLWKSSKEVRETLFLPANIRHYLFKGLYNVVNGSSGTARPYTIRTLMDNPQKRKNYIALKESLIGKTSTAEISYRPCLNRDFNPLLCKHLWFATASFTDENFNDSDLVVAVLLRYGDHGKEAAPLAAELIQKWRAICASTPQP